MPLRTAVPVQPVPSVRTLAPGRAAPSARRTCAGPVRLTRRGRIVLGGLVVMIAAAAVGLFSLSLAGGALASSHGPAGAGYRGMRQLVVQPGQTLWSIAAAAEPTADPRLVMAQIAASNALAGATVYAGEQLWVPAR